ncbi:hypothetical protein QFZ53_001447 [Microbacterium natoriense]|uniref:ABC-2 family transporter protein n=1 Tax=Microbacterium natoriense TaxID=284570 RepID=A0AAW8EYF1_9MICO|nr:hypothetical protein [Microbacterium natoriense]MDQ0647251.1 hypothetical protein [Microbacterium natoriense]
MRNMLQEIRREFRWVINSGLALALVGAAIAIVISGAAAGTSSTFSLVSQFEHTLSVFQENGEDIAKALSTPAEVTGAATQQNISNPLRYDLDRATEALTQTTGLGAIASTLSLSTFIFFPLIGFALGIFTATHDTKSGSIAFRWPQSGIRGVAGTKPVALFAIIAALVVLSAAGSGIASLITGPLAEEEASTLGAFIPPGPSVARTLTIGMLAVLIGTVSAWFGLFVGVATRNRAFTLVAFALAYYLLPMLGPWDLRNMIPLAGTDIFYFVGQFTPFALGELDPALGLGILIGFALFCAGTAVLIWHYRARLPNTAQ